MSEAGGAPLKALTKLRALCVKAGMTDKDADAFVECTMILGRAAALGDGGLQEIFEAYERMDRLIDRYPGIQRKEGVRDD